MAWHEDRNGEKNVGSKDGNPNPNPMARPGPTRHTQDGEVSRQVCGVCGEKGHAPEVCCNVKLPTMGLPVVRGRRPSFVVHQASYVVPLSPKGRDLFEGAICLNDKSGA